MTRLNRALCIALASTAMVAASFSTLAQDNTRQSTVSIYRVAPGKQLAFLKWMAAREAVDREAGVAATQWYAHMDGDSWDYVAISPDLDEATSDRVDDMQRKRGLKVGPQGGLEFREMIGTHTDTLAAGPYSAAELVDRASKP